MQKILKLTIHNERSTVQPHLALYITVGDLKVVPEQSVCQTVQNVFGNDYQLLF